jgi:hypothetical protein
VGELEPEDVNMGEAHKAKSPEDSRTTTPGMELVEVSRNTQWRIPCKVAAAASQGSSLVSWAAIIKEVVTAKGTFKF